MTEAQPPAPPSQPPDEQPDPEAAALAEIDRVLQEEDPDFQKQLDEMRTVEFDQNVEIEASAIDETGEEEKPEESIEAKPPTWKERFKFRLKVAIIGLKVRLTAAFSAAVVASWQFLRTRPKEFFFYGLAVLKILGRRALAPVRAFQSASRLQKITALILIAMILGAGAVLMANFKGIWVPQLNEPILSSLAPHADWVETFDPADGTESFYGAFPQERHEFLFGKFKVNLRRSDGHPNPMGAFEMIVQLDSKDTAIEVSDREVEFFDLIQRTFEDEAYPDLESELGKSRFKSRLKRELNQKLTQGWVKDINFKTFILKP